MSCSSHVQVMFKSCSSHVPLIPCSYSSMVEQSPYKALILVQFQVGAPFIVWESEMKDTCRFIGQASLFILGIFILAVGVSLLFGP